mgnify:CR=1 FL=1
MEQPAAIRIRDLVKRYAPAGQGEGKLALKGVSFDVPQGEIFGLLGPNGAGKTTTIRMCLGLATPDAGEVSFFPGGGAPALQMPADALAIKARLGIVSQFDSLDPDFSCAENLLVFGRYFGMPDALIKARIPQLLEFASLTHKADAKLSELSGGMKMRASIARALVMQPKLLLMDEPFAALDVASIRALQNMLAKWSQPSAWVLADYQVPKDVPVQTLIDLGD